MQKLNTKNNFKDKRRNPRKPKEGEPIYAQSLEKICAEIKAVADMGVEIGLVVGGGNIFEVYKVV